jgi:hypothetical protein
MNSAFSKEMQMNRFFRSLSVLAVFLTALVLLLGESATAQTFRGTILGIITDSSGASVPGATVTIKNVDTGLVRTVTTSDDGSYAAPELPIGNYSVTVEKNGFKSGVVTGVRVEVSSERRADFTLQPGEIAQSVEVLGEELSQVSTTEDTLGGIIESKVAANLPVNGRDYQKLIFLVPGVTGSPDQITDSPGSFGIFSVNGARGRANNFLLDGTDMNDGYRNDPAINEAGVFGTPATILPVEAIAELHVASNFEAEYGRSAGGVVNVVTKSGTNTFHGSVFDYFRNNALDARNYFNTVGLPQNPFHNNQFGASLGGPIVKDKVFFFVDYEGTRETGKQATASCVPTKNDILFNAPTPGDLSSINTVSANILAKKGWPAPTGSGSCLGNPVDGAPVGSNTVLATPFSNDINGGIIKVDYNINKSNQLTGRYYIGDSTQIFPLALVGGGALPGYSTNTPTRVQLVSISFVSVLTPSIVNEARLGWNRFVEGFYPEDRSFNPSSIGLNTGTTGINLGLPRINVGSFPQLGANSGDPRNRVDSNWHIIDNISWKNGKHDVKFGYEFRRTTVSQNFNANFRGTIKFSSLGSFLAGIPTSTGSSQLSGDTNRNTLENSNGFYVQDSYHWTRNFTLNFGIRYDIYGVVQEKHQNFSNVNPLNGQGYAVGGRNLYQPSYNDFAPRVSVAWDVTGKQRTVIRAGYGYFFDAFSQDMFMGHLPFNSSFDPGPTYNGFFGPNLISTAGIYKGCATTPCALNSVNPVFGATSPMGDGFGVDQNLVTPYMANYNLNLQQQLTRTMTLQIGYVGSQGHKLFRFRDINQPTLLQIQQTNYAVLSGYNPAIPNNGSIAGCGCVPRFFPSSPFYYINYLESSANSNYNSLQISYQINNWHGLTSQLNYTWSHSIDDASDGEDYVPNASQPDNSQALIRYNRGNSNFDVRNRFVWNFIYQLPNSKDSRFKLIRNGWGVNGIVTLQAGQPFHLNYNFEDDYNGSGEYFGRPDVVGPIVYHQRDPNNFLRLSSFAVPCTLAQGTGAGNCQMINPSTGAICTGQAVGPNCINSMHFGNLGRNSLLGPNFRQVDFSIFKDTHLTERLMMQLRFEAYNLFNHPNFSNPYLPLFIADAAQQGFNANGTSAGAYHLTATGDVGIGYPFLGSGGPRGLQIAAKFSF